MTPTSPIHDTAGRGGPPSYIQMRPEEGFRNPGARPLGLRLVSTACSAVSFVTFFMFGIGYGLIAFAVVSFYFLASLLVLGLIADAAVSWRPFLVLRLVLGLLLFGGFVLVFSYSGASYGAHSSKLTMFRIARKCRKKCEIRAA